MKRPQCPRCAGQIVHTDPEEPFCVTCGHRTSWSVRGSSVGQSPLADFIGGTAKPRAPDSPREPRMTAGRFPSCMVSIDTTTGRQVRIRYVSLTPKEATYEGIEWDRRPHMLTPREGRQIGRRFREQTGLRLRGFSWATR